MKIYHTENVNYTEQVSAFVFAGIGFKKKIFGEFRQPWNEKRSSQNGIMFSFFLDAIY